MFRHLYSVLIAVIVLTVDPIEARRSSSSGGASSSRGASGARTGVQSGNGFNNGGGGFNGGRPNQPSGGFSNTNQGFHPNNNQGGFHPNSNVRPNGNFNQGGGFHPNTNNGFRPGTGLGSSSSSGTFKKALIGGALGAAGGILAYEAGKAIIKSATEPFNYNGRNYNWDNHGQVKNGEFQCSMPLSQLTGQGSTTTSTTTTTTTAAPVDGSTTTVEPVSSTTASPDQVLQNIQYADGSRPKTIVWGCKVGREQCCGTDCCPIPPQNQQSNPNSAGNAGLGVGGAIMMVILILLLLCCCCCIGAYMCCRSVFDCFSSSDEHKNDHGYQGMSQDEYNGSQQYQMQNYAQPQQPQQQYYPQQPQHGSYPQSGNYYPPNQYPSNPNY